MNFERYAKALVAFAVAPVTMVILMALCGAANPRLYLGALLIGTVAGFACALAVYLVPNRTHGFNVNDIADVLIKSGLDAVDQNEDIKNG